MKRFTETDKWGDPWFRKLPGAHKLLFIFLIENCNNAGFYEFDEDHAAYLTGLEKKHVEGALKGLERGIYAASGWVWVKRFLRHQKNEALNEENPAHRNIIALLKLQIDRFSDSPEFLSFVAPYKGLLSPIGKGTGKGHVAGTKGSAEGGSIKKPQTVEEAKEYAKGIGMPPDEVDKWHDHFEANGWKVGRAGIAVKDWKATMRTWKGNAIKFHNNGSTRPVARKGPAPQPIHIPGDNLL